MWPQIKYNRFIEIYSINQNIWTVPQKISGGAFDYTLCPHYFFQSLFRVKFMEPKYIILYVLGLAFLVNVISYVYRKRVVSARKEGRYLKAGVWQVGNCNNITRNPLLRGLNELFSVDFRLVTGFGLFIVGMLSPIFVLLLVFELVETSGLTFLTEPTPIARWLDQNPVIDKWFVTSLAVVFLVVLLYNLYYLFAKIKPLYSRYYLEYQGGVLQLMGRISGKELVAIDFSKPYQHKIILDTDEPAGIIVQIIISILRTIRGIIVFFTGHASNSPNTPRKVHVFSQNNKSIALMHNVSTSKGKGNRGEKQTSRDAASKNIGAILYEVKLGGWGDCRQELGDIIKKYAFH